MTNGTGGRRASTLSLAFCSRFDPQRMKSPAVAILLATLLLQTPIVLAAAQPGVPESRGSSEDTVIYPASFFSGYQPVSARDIVEQVPGFQVSDGDGGRGFAGAGGNVLINGERPSSKQDSISSILARIPASRVERVELIRGNTGRFDAGGQTMLVNVIVDTSHRAWTWSSTVEQDLDSGGPTPSGRLSAVDRIGSTTWGAGISAGSGFFGNTMKERLLVAGIDVEDRDEFERSRSRSLQLNANSATSFDAATLRLNSEIIYRESDFLERSRRTPVAEPENAFNLNQRSDDSVLEFEVGGDFEWQPAPLWKATLIALHNSKIVDDENREVLIVATVPPDLRRQSVRDSSQRESIGRLELDWTATGAHLVELDFETALNSLDNALVLRVATEGELIPVDVPGANNRVEEIRGDFELRDTWQFGAFSLESAIGAEISRISQSGSDASDRDFFFLKPSLTLVHAPHERVLNRVRVRRDIAQLNFGDFISSANFFDDDVDRGNPGLEPQQTLATEISSERRFGELGVAKLTVFHDWVSDVQDRLPINGLFEVPGNIGNGRRWGASAEGTIALERIGMQQARLDLEARWEDSAVIDPVTGTTRRFSGQRSYALEGELRQDLVKAGWAWGIESDYVDRAVAFELEELDIDKEGVDLEAFVETTRYFGVKMQLIIQNLLDRRFVRDRTVFAGPRGSSEVDFREIRDLRRGRSVLLSISGSF